MSTKQKIYMRISILSILTFTLLYLFPLSSYGGKKNIIFDKPQKRESMRKSKVTPVVFPHLKHKELYAYKCKVCHKGIFKPELGANKMSMQTIIQGKHCGKCHNGVIAFSPLDCKACHLIKQ
ncbi:MAG: c(7)-type cytochrome triheme domain-containing protein [Thermodesulfobacteriota bacterium]